MVKTRKASRKKGKKAIDAVLISHKSTCNSLDLPLYLSCRICSFKKEHDVAITKKGGTQKLISAKNIIFFCKQRWTREYVDIQNAPESRFCAHILTFNYISVKPFIEIEHESKSKHNITKVNPKPRNPPKKENE